MPRAARKNRDTFVCPNCGEDVARDAIICPHCGADDDTGWSADAEYDDLDLPTRDDDDEEDWSFEKENRSDGIGTMWKVVAVILLIVIAVLVLAGGW